MWSMPFPTCPISVNLPLPSTTTALSRTYNMASLSVAASSDERTPLLPASIEYNDNPDNPANLSKAKIVTILAANWVSRTRTM